MDEREIIAKNIVYYRKKMGISQLELAQKLQYSNKNISKWEKAETTPSVFTLKRLAEIFGVSMDDLFVQNVTENQTPQPTQPTKMPSWMLSKWLFLALANAILLVGCCIAVWVLGLIKITFFNRYLLFLYCTPLSALSIFVFLTCINKRMDLVFISVSGWLLAVCIYVTFINVPYVWFIFYVMGALQVLTICISLIINVYINTKNKLKKQKTDA